MSSLTDTLTLEAFNDLQSFFRTGTSGHQPSPNMLNGLFNLQTTLSRMLAGELDPRMYVSALDPGVGKTSAIKAWLKVYLANRRMFPDKGVILCFDRHEEIKEFHRGDPLPPDVFGVFVSERTPLGKELNSYGVGSQNIADAPILFTTKQQIIRKGKQFGSFGGIELFHYHGIPRPVHVWDESAIVGRPLFTTRGRIQELSGTLENEDQEMYEVLDYLAYELKHCKDKDLIEFPDIGGADFRYRHKWLSDQATETAETLSMLSGKVVTIRAEGNGRVVLTCVESIPDDFFPFLVTDASARVRKTYSLLNKYHDKVTYLGPSEAVKKYDPLTIHVWERSSSKEHYKRHGVEETAGEIVKLVMSRPSEPFLIVTMKGEKEWIRYRWEKVIKAQLPEEDHSRLHFLTWNRHTATNNYSHIPNVILTSLLNYKPYQYEVNGRAAAFLPSSVGELTEDQLKDFRNGEHAHHLLQCICRGAVRNAKGEYCHEARCWIVTANKTVIEDLLPGIFPGCRIETWKRKEQQRGNLTHHEAVRFILEVCSDLSPQKVVSRLRTHLGFGPSEKSNFRKTFLENQGFLDLCTEAGIIIDKGENGRWTMERNPFL